MMNESKITASHSKGNRTWPFKWRFLARRMVTCVFAMGVIALGTRANAQVGFWDGVRDPHANVRAAARRLIRAYVAVPELREVTAACLTVEPFADAELKYLCGCRLERAHDDMKQKALALLHAAILEAPERPWVGAAWFEVGAVEAGLGRPDRAIRAFSASLRSVWQPELRAELHLNRGLAYTLSGELDYAIADYRRALVLAKGAELFAQAQFALGVALERHGDLASGLAAISLGLNVQQAPAASTLKDQPRTVHGLLPPWEIYYYKALTAMAEGNSARTREVAEISYRKAILAWDAYLEEGGKVSARWLDRAEALRSRCEVSLKELDKNGAVGRTPERSLRGLAQ